MSNDLEISDVYSRRRLWPIRSVGSLTALLIIAVGVGIDLRNPPLTTDGFILGGVLGSFLGTAVSSWLLRYAKPDDIEIETQDGEAFGAAVVAVFALLPIYIAAALCLALGVGIISLVLPISFPGSDPFIAPSVIIAAIIVSIIVPEWSLNDVDDVTIRQKNTPSDSTSLSDVEDNVTQTHVDGVKVKQEDTPSDSTSLSDVDDNVTQTKDKDASSVRDTDLEKAFEGLLGSIEDAQARAEEAIENGYYESAIEQLETAKESCKDAAKINEKHNLGGSEEITAKETELENLLLQAENNPNQGSNKGPDDESDPESTAVRRKAENLIDASREAIEEREFETAAYRISKVESIIEDAGTDSDLDVKQLQAEVDELEERLRSEIREEVHELLSSAEERYEQSRARLGSDYYEKGYDQAKAQLELGLDSLSKAEKLCNRYDPEWEDTITDTKAEIRSLLETVSSKPAKDLATKIQQAKAISETVHERIGEHVKEIESTLDELKAQRDATQRGIHSSDYDRAEEALDQLQNSISKLEELEGAESITSAFKQEAEELEQEIAIGRASTRINGFLGAVSSSRSQAEQLLEEGTYDQAISRLEAALDSLDQAEEINDRHVLGREDTIEKKRKELLSLLETASNKPAEDLSIKIQEAEDSISNGIQARTREDFSAAVESFETARNRYEAAHDLASQYDLAQQWEVAQRRSMVQEYYEVTQETLDKRRQTVEDGLEQTLEAAESVIHQAEQHIEVDDFVSARESLTQARDQIDDAAQLLDIGVATNPFKTRYTEVKQREKHLREQIPDSDGSEKYRARDLVESLQVLSTKLGESPRPEFVNQYGEYPADAYLEMFGSWPESLAAANLDPIDEVGRERRSYSRVEVLDAIVALADELGHPPSKGEMNKKGGMSASPVESRFKNWETALEVAGVTSDGTEKDGEAIDSNESKQEDEKEDGILGEIENEIQSFELD